MSSLPSRTSRVFSRTCVLAGALALGFLVGCIADSAEDSDLPWSSNRNWEGLGPLPSVITDRYD